MGIKVRRPIKAVFILLFWIGISAAGRAQPSRSRITVYSVYFGIESIIAVPCDQFKTQFEKRMDTTVCLAPDTLRAVASFLQHVRFGSHRDHIDTRAQFVFVDTGGKTTVICMDRWDICIDGQIIRGYPAFYRYLRLLVPKRNTDWRVKRP